MPQKTSMNGGQASPEVAALVREAAAVRGNRTGPHTESGVDLLTLRFDRNLHRLANTLTKEAVEQAEQQAKAAAQDMLDNAKAEAEEIVQAATQRANDLDTKLEAMTRDLAERINEQYTSFMGAIENVVSKPGDSAKGSEDNSEARIGNHSEREDLNPIPIALRS